VTLGVKSKSQVIVPSAQDLVSPPARISARFLLGQLFRPASPLDLFDNGPQKVNCRFVGSQVAQSFGVAHGQVRAYYPEPRVVVPARRVRR